MDNDAEAKGQQAQEHQQESGWWKDEHHGYGKQALADEQGHQKEREVHSQGMNDPPDSHLSSVGSKHGWRPC